VHRGDPAERHRVDVATDLTGDLSRGQHRHRPRSPMPRLSVARGHPTPTASGVPPALRVRYLLHRKGLSCRSALRSLTR
jgi:hypothetical protein